MSGHGNNNGGGCRKCNETQKRLEAIENMLVELRETVARLAKAQPEKEYVFQSQPTQMQIDLSSLKFSEFDNE